MSFISRRRTPEEVAAFEDSCTWPEGQGPRPPDVLPLDYPEPEGALHTCFHCKKRTTQGPEIADNFFDPGHTVAMPSHCARATCVDALSDTLILARNRRIS